MDASLYKTCRTSRGLTYNYLRAPAEAGKPTLLLLHGFPSTSYDWRRVVPYMRAQGYGLVVPDMLGYGGTDKPTDVKMFTQKAIARDIVDVLDHEKVEKAIAIGHDWGSLTTARLRNHFPERFSAYGFLAVAYIPPSVARDPQELNKQTKALLGYELYGYWYFFSEDGADKLIEDHIDSFQSLLWPGDPTLWKTDFAPLGAAKAWLTADKKSAGAPYVPEDERAAVKAHLLKGGFASPLNWYKTMTQGLNGADDSALPGDVQLISDVPAFFAACEKDYICLAAQQKDSFSKTCAKGTVKSYDADHWVLLSHAEQLNKDLDEWIKSV